MDDDVDPAPDPARDPARDPAWPSRRPSPTARLRAAVLPGLLVVLLVAVLATAAVLLLDRVHTDDADPSAAPASADVVAAVRVAQEAARTYYDLDADRLGRSVQQMRPLATAAFQRRYAAKVGELAQQARSGGVVLTASVPPDGAATEYVSSSVARVLVALDVRRSSDGVRATTQPVAVRITLERDGTRWLVNALEVTG